MNIDYETMKRIHNVQYIMLKELIRVMDILKIKYYFVHGSLLGAIRDGDFIAEDDDIDIAIFRKDYNKLMEVGNLYLSNELFLQCSENDDFPLAFGKLRNNNTSFIQGVLDKYNCNQGIYIDIFPIDFAPAKSSFFEKRIKLMNLRICKRMPNKNVKKKFLTLISLLLYPSYNKTVKMREKLLKKSVDGQFVSIYGGKSSEMRMPIEWFGDPIKIMFREIEVSCPSNYKEYLSRIYGIDYLNHNPANERIDEHKKIAISAKILDFDKSYKNYK